MAEFIINPDSMIPSADSYREAGFQELVRCKDCVYWSSEEKRNRQTAWLPCMEIKTGRNWFCANGAKKAD